MIQVMQVTKSNPLKSMKQMVFLISNLLGRLDHESEC